MCRNIFLDCITITLQDYFSIITHCRINLRNGAGNLDSTLGEHPAVTEILSGGQVYLTKDSLRDRQLDVLSKVQDYSYKRQHCQIAKDWCSILHCPS
jgi:hypothetical protein